MGCMKFLVDYKFNIRSQNLSLEFSKFVKMRLNWFSAYHGLTSRLRNFMVENGE